ncbi:transmembrane protein, putative (macronuclear) [Tetrahymena thermophila SB210]|uniref:Transmembrane protein, putative n=1 Tax=Tetrahymena thermophila (strain SB210) TaxID=312017 RepID=W7WVS4_TETTS|nr:transmembrane protein, putative [Tetrahymena thermophila SB210]EWS70930.1 transmembrane protein, putative [Tetrahymena thermophila SB210]|eukprot:XP_012656545.1 transmembrane protein, putative [Tetrahymena thermophila SB210]
MIAIYYLHQQSHIINQPLFSNLFSYSFSDQKKLQIFDFQKYKIQLKNQQGSLLSVDLSFFSTFQIIYNTFIRLELNIFDFLKELKQILFNLFQFLLLQNQICFLICQPKIFDWQQKKKQKIAIASEVEQHKNSSYSRQMLIFERIEVLNTRYLVNALYTCRSAQIVLLIALKLKINIRTSSSCGYYPLKVIKDYIRIYLTQSQVFILDLKVSISQSVTRVKQNMIYCFQIYYQFQLIILIYILSLYILQISLICKVNYTCPLFLVNFIYLFVGLSI